MNIPIWILVAGVVCLPLFGFLICAVLTAGKVADVQDERNRPLIDASAAIEQSRDLHAAHSRCADALAAKSDRIERALECVTENSAHVGKKMAAILKGDR